MTIKLWSRKEGLVQPPAELLHAEQGSNYKFPETLRIRVFRWSLDALRRLQWASGMGDLFNPIEGSVKRLYNELCSAHGRAPLVAFSPPSQATARPEYQLEAHVQHGTDLEVMDCVDAVFQISAALIEEQGGADPEEEPGRLGEEINAIFEEEGVGYRWAEGQLVRLDDETIP